jgi:hypothetical protein
MPTARSTPVVPTPSSMTAVAPPSPPQRDGNPTANPIRALHGFGQSVWLDYLWRSLFTSGEFRRLIVEDGLRGATSNPSIFEKAIAGSTDYLDALHEIEGVHDAEPMALYEALAIRDIRDAADLLRPVYDATAQVRDDSRTQPPPGVFSETHEDRRQGGTRQRALYGHHRS